MLKCGWNQGITCAQAMKPDKNHRDLRGKAFTLASIEVVPPSRMVLRKRGVVPAGITFVSLCFFSDVSRGQACVLRHA